MNKYSSVSIPKLLIENYSQYDLSAEEVLLLIQLITIDDCEVNLVEFLEKYEISKSKINILLQKQMVSVFEKAGVIMINILPLYEKLYGRVSNRDEEVKNFALSNQEIDKLKYMFNKELKPFELEQIKNWKKQGFNFKQIEDAIYKALVKNVMNLNYIQAILENEISLKTSSKSEEKDVHVVRNWTFE